jgi:hypothetical protein
MSSLIFFANSSARRRFSRSTADSFGGGRRAALMGSEREWFPFVEFIWGVNVAEGLEVHWSGREDRNAGEVKEAGKQGFQAFATISLPEGGQMHPTLLSCKRKINPIRITKLYVTLPNQPLALPIPVRVPLLPVPKVSAHSPQILWRLEPKFYLS